MVAGPALAAPVPGLTEPGARWLLATGLGLLALLLAVLWLGSRRLRRQSDTLACIDTAPWPALTVFVQVRPQDPALSACLQALLSTAYPAQKLRIVPISEQGDTQGRAIIDAYALLFPERVHPCHRQTAEAGAGPAWREALPLAQGDLAVWIGSSQMPGPGLFKQLARPFFDPEVGIVLGAQTAPGVPAEPAGRPVPLAAVRLSAVDASGGWAGFNLTDTQQLARRLQAKGWHRVVNPQARYEAAPVPATRSEPLRKAPPTRNTPVLMEHT